MLYRSEQQNSLYKIFMKTTKNLGTLVEYLVTIIEYEYFLFQGMFTSCIHVFNASMQTSYDYELS